MPPIVTDRVAWSVGLSVCHEIRGACYVSDDAPNVPRRIFCSVVFYINFVDFIVRQLTDVVHLL